MESNRLNRAHLLGAFRYCPVCGSGSFFENNAASKRCEACGFIYYINPRAAVAAFILSRERELLVCRRAKDPAKGTLDLPGGFTDCFETAEEAVVREVSEETRLKVVCSRYLFSLPNIYRYSGIDIHTMDLFFACEVSWDTPAEAQDDAAELLFIPLSQLNASDFGLVSIRAAVSRFLADYSRK